SEPHSPRRRNAGSDDQGQPSAHHLPTMVKRLDQRSSAPDNSVPPAPAEYLLPQDLVDHPRYRVLELLGRGGMGTVYKAWHRFMDRPVALKIVNPDLVNRPAMVERFRREVRAAGRLSHPHIVASLGADQARVTR